MKNLLIKNTSGLKLFIVILCIYILLYFFNNQAFFNSMGVFLEMLINILPILLLIFLLMFFFNIILDSEKNIKKISKVRGIIGYIIFIFFGIISSGPIYMWYPLLADLKAKGVKNSLLVTFLYNRAVKIPLIPIMIYYFGVKYVIILTLFMIGFSVINGIIVDKLLTQKK